MPSSLTREHFDEAVKTLATKVEVEAVGNRIDGVEKRFTARLEGVDKGLSPVYS